MNPLPGTPLPTIQESAFLQLLDGDGTVKVGIQRFGRYFVPFVYYMPPDGEEHVPCGVIVRQRGMWAAATRAELLDVLCDITGPDAGWGVEQTDMPEDCVALRVRLHAPDGAAH